QREAISAGCTHRVEQSVEHERARFGRRPLEPERDEARKFLDVQRGVDRETARGKTELPRVAGARAEVARAEKDCDVVPPVRRGMHAKAGERQVRGQLARVDAAAVELEHVGAVTYRARFAADELEQLDRLFEAAAAMEKFQAKRALRLRPERVIVPKADRLILVVRQLAQELRCELFR